MSPHLETPRKRRGLLLLISSPSGAGKTSLSRRLVADHADLALSISATTRPPRPVPRVACRTAAATGAAAVLCLAFPVHPPGKPEKSRIDELDGVQVPVLVVQGERDPFGMPPEAPNRTVVKVAGDHSLKADLEAVAAATMQEDAGAPPNDLGPAARHSETEAEREQVEKRLTERGDDLGPRANVAA